MEYRAIWNIQAVLQATYSKCQLTSNWSRICETIDKLKPVLNVKQVTLEQTRRGKNQDQHGWKYIKENGHAGIGGIIRDSNGDFISAFSKPVQCTSNNQVAALAVKYGTQWGIARSFDNFNMELDSLAITNMLVKN